LVAALAHGPISFPAGDKEPKKPGMAVGDKMLLVSVIIPTHNRKFTLQRTLDALAGQTLSPRDMEVLVVSDGCTDGTAEMVHGYHAPFPLQVVEQTGEGPAAARNHGAALASGKLLLFLDDDVEAAPSLVENHVRAHRSRPNEVVIGYLPPVHPSGPASFFHMGLRAWWEDKFYLMRQAGYRYTYSDLLSGNFSLEAELFASVGGFDPALQCHEDYELGIRLIKAGVTFCFASDAVGYHHEITDLECSFKRKYDEGKADVLIGQRHPDLRPILPMARLEAYSLSNRISRRLAFRWPMVGDIVAGLLRLVLGLLEWGRIRGFWQRLYQGLLTYWYWRGVAGELGKPLALGSSLQPSPGIPETQICRTEIDLSEGLKAAKQKIDHERPTSVYIRFKQHFIGYIPPQPGAEPLRGAHLRSILLTNMLQPMLVAMAMEGILSPRVAVRSQMSNKSLTDKVVDGLPTGG
jgi:GT2 family glycosyltransferase